jgi:hypothetical protein
MLAVVVGWASAPINLYPGVARLAGANNTAWRSSAVLHNPTASTQSALLELLARGGSAVTASATEQLAPGETREIANLYDFLHAADGAGMLRVTGSVITWVRAYNEGTGTFGQDLPAVSPGAGFAPNAAIVFPFATPADIKRDFRSNLMLVNLGSSDLTVTITAGASAGTQVVPAGAYVQINNLGAFLGASAGFSTAHVSADGEWFGAISTIDPYTGDPTTVRGLSSGEAGERYFPGIAQLAGANGATWRSEAVVYNPSDTASSTTLDLISRGSSQTVASTLLTLGPHETRRIGNLYDFLGVAQGAGTLRVTGPALAWVRAYNQRPHPGSTATETFGQDVPPVDSGSGIPARAFVALPFEMPASTATGFRSNLVLLNLEDHDITVSLRAGAVTKTQAVPAGAYVQIDKLGAFLGVPVAASTVWGIADGRWATAISTIDPFTNDPTTFRAAEEWQPPSSADLIDAALAAHAISSEQALTYKVFAEVGDTRLPPQYAGDDRSAIEPESLNTAAQQLPSLSAGTQSLIGPYLVPPFWVGSAWDLKHASAARSAWPAAVVTAACLPWQGSCGILSASWSYVGGDHVRVWFEEGNRDTDRPIADDLVFQAEQVVWPELLAVTGTQALPADIGGVKRLDIALVDPSDMGGDYLGLTETYPGTGCKHVPAFIRILRIMGNQQLFRSVLAHEMMHAFQDAFYTNLCSGDYTWLKEATATWFEDDIYPAYDREHIYAPVYLASTQFSLNYVNEKSYPNREYSAYLFFFYLTRIRAPSAEQPGRLALPTTVIGDIFRATETMDSLHAVQSGVEKNGATLDDAWPDFAVYCWNRAGPINRFLTIDHLFFHAAMQEKLDADAAPWLVTLADAAQLELPSLSARYFEIDIPSADVSSITFYNGLDFAIEKQDVDPFGTVYAANPPSTAQPGAHVDALIKIGDQWTHEDWTKERFKPYCIDLKAERVQQLIIILTNSDVSSQSSVKVPGRLPPGVLASNVGCASWQGSADLTYNTGPDSPTEHFVASDVLAEAIGASGDDESALIFHLFRVTGGTFSWTASGGSSGCTYKGSLAGVSVVDPGDLFMTTDLVVGKNWLGLWLSLFAPWVTLEPMITVTCPSGTSYWPWDGPEVSLDAMPSDAWARVSPDGKTIHLDVANNPNNVYGWVKGTWTFTAKREP